MYKNKFHQVNKILICETRMFAINQHIIIDHTFDTQLEMINLIYFGSLREQWFLNTLLSRM